MDAWLKEAEAKLEEAYAANAKRDEIEKENVTTDQNVLIKNNEFSVVTDRKIEADMSISAYNRKIRDSGVINHFVLCEKTGEFRCAGITFPNGDYVHVDTEIPEKSILTSTES